MERKGKVLTLLLLSCWLLLLDEWLNWKRIRQIRDEEGVKPEKREWRSCGT